jgi:hypothetical protein
MRPNAAKKPPTKLRRAKHSQSKSLTFSPWSQRGRGCRAPLLFGEGVSFVPLGFKNNRLARLVVQNRSGLCHPHSALDDAPDSKESFLWKDFSGDRMENSEARFSPLTLGRILGRLFSMGVLSTQFAHAPFDTVFFVVQIAQIAIDELDARRNRRDMLTTHFSKNHVRQFFLQWRGLVVKLPDLRFDFLSSLAELVILAKRFFFFDHLLPPRPGA